MSQSNEIDYAIPCSYPVTTYTRYNRQSAKPNNSPWLGEQSIKNAQKRKQVREGPEAI